MPTTTNALEQFTNLPDDARARLPVVCALFGISAPTVWRWTKSGRLPTPVRQGGVTAWRVGDLRRVLAQA